MVFINNLKQSGSGEFNSWITLNEYGLYTCLNGNKTGLVKVDAESDIFKCIGLKWVDPVDRELKFFGIIRLTFLIFIF